MFTHSFVLSLLLLFSFKTIPGQCSVTLFAPFNAIGLRGNITFRQEREDSEVTVAINLSPIEPSDKSTDFSWKIMSNPYYLDSPCREENLGRIDHDMSTRHGPIQVPSMNPGQMAQVFTDQELLLRGHRTIWSSSIILRKGSQQGCTNIHIEGDVRTAQATFHTPFAGTVVFRENELGDTLILSNLFYIGDDFRVTSKHDWRIFVTDILDTKPNRDRKCHYLTTLLDPDNTDDSNCSDRSHKNCKIGDLLRKHGQVTVYKSNDRSSKQKFIDTNLPLSIFDSTRSAYLIVYEKNSPNRVLSCALISPLEKKEVKALIDMDGVKGHIGFSQTYNTDPTIVTIKLDNLKGRGYFYQINKFPVPPRIESSDELCSEFSVGGLYNPFRVSTSHSPKPGHGTVDQYAVGDLSGKYGPLSDDNEVGHVISINVDLNLPLFGRHSIIGRSLVISKIDGAPWICASIGYPGQVITARATFNFPVVGHVIFRQEIDKPEAETTVFADLSYADGSANDTSDHVWDIHLDPPGRDFHNWSERCESAGKDYNPFEVGVSKYSACASNNPYRCRLGDLATKSGSKLSIAGYRGSSQVKIFYTDLALPLSGRNSILGRSLVIHDERGPKQRGNRMACTAIRRVHPMTVSVRIWRFGSGAESKISGAFVFHQSSPYDGTQGKIDLHALSSLASGFHVHEVWVPEDREFPCSQDSVYGHFNPYNLDSAVTHYPGIGSADQYQVGDLSGKVGTLDGKDSWRHTYYDTNLPLYGTNSIVGRSVVIHKAERDSRWVCGTISPEERKDNAREIVALASFDDPKHLIAGYIRFRQFEYKDGSTSDTWLEIDLKHAGLYNRNLTKGHKWSVFVNQVGADAFQGVESVRCVAAGYLWNPYYVDAFNQDLYRRDCSRKNPLRCQMGDLAGRNGPLSIGGRRLVISDSNLPLVGNYSVLGRSLIIYRKDGSDTKMACANILPDFHLITNIAVRYHPTFTVAKFMDHMRLLLNATDWLIRAEAKSTKIILDGECIQITVNFYGPKAFKFQEEFSNLVNFGTVHRNDRFGQIKISTYYSPCKPMDSGSNGINSFPGLVILIILMTSLMRIMN